jgi:hypothetical protein
MGIRGTDSYCAGATDRYALEMCKTRPVIQLGRVCKRSESIAWLRSSCHLEINNSPWSGRAHGYSNSCRPLRPWSVEVTSCVSQTLHEFGLCKYNSCSLFHPLPPNAHVHSDTHCLLLCLFCPPHTGKNTHLYFLLHTRSFSLSHTFTLYLFCVYTQLHILSHSLSHSHSLSSSKSVCSFCRRLLVTFFHFT